jgi:Uma2 family endonuclease
VAVEPSRLLFTVDEYEALGQVEAFWHRRLELIEGEIIEMTPIGSDHARGVRRLNALLTSRLRSAAVVDVQSPLRLGDLSEPQPDLSVLAPPMERYDDRLPTADDVLLTIEVSDTTLRFDRMVKAPLYARHGVAELWIVDLNGEAVEVHRGETMTRHGRGDAVSPLAFPDVSVGVDEILG